MKKDGYDTTVDFFGLRMTDDDSVFQYDSKSRGVVEAKENQIHIGMYGYSWRGCYYDDEWDPETGDLVITYREVSYDVEDQGHVFFEADGNNVTFSMLLDGKLYPEIVKTDGKVIFYDTHLFIDDCAGDQSITNFEKVIFENRDGEYRYVTDNLNIGQSRFGGVTFIPPQMPGSVDRDSGYRLCQKYMRALYAAFFGAEEYTASDGQLFRHMEGTDDIFCARIDDFLLEGKLGVAWPDDYFGGYNFEQACFGIERVSFTENNVTVALVPKGYYSSLEIDVYDIAQKKSYHGTFDELRKRSSFPDGALPGYLRLNRGFSDFSKEKEIYTDIRKTLVDYGVHNLIPKYDPKEQMSRQAVRGRLYDADMIEDEEVISLAMEMHKQFLREGKIPNIALVGEAGTGKTELAGRLAGLFGKGLLSVSASDLKAQFEGWGVKEVAEKILEAATDNKVLFIDEAYTLMEDAGGREAVSILLPFMTGDRKKAEAEYGGGTTYKTLSVDFEEGKGKKDGRTFEIGHEVPPIWVAGYEDDIRLMISKNQGLFRRLKRVTIKTPTTDELYRELLGLLEKKLKDIHTGDDLFDACDILTQQFKGNRKQIKRFLGWGAQPQNSRYFANHAGVRAFLDRCIDGIDFEKPKDDITAQIANIITLTKRDIKHQLDTIKRKGNSSSGSDYDVSEQVAMVSDIETRFKDLKGCDSQIRYMKDIIALLVEKSMYEGLNISIPKGALLLGMPGVGKTFIARAMAGELQEAFEGTNQRVGFMSLSAPELTAKPESFISSIFDTAEEYDVCVIFIDEVDAIAKNRFQNKFYSHFIELIKQMDGIEQRSNVFILAATNAPESLDPAFTRSGRIDKELSFTLPDKTVRAELAKGNLVKRCGALRNFVYPASEAGTGRNAGRHMEESSEKNRKGIEMLAERVAEITRGYTPGDIENVINEAFIRYMQEKHPESGEKRLPGRNAPESGEKGLPDRNAPEFGNAELDCLYGLIYEAVERKNIGDPHPADREEHFSIEKNNQSCSSVSIHEVGHAVVSRLYGCEPFEKITSLPRGSALGYVMLSQKAPLTKRDYENRIRCAMGGRIAEELVYGKEDISVGAWEDMKTATGFARAMVERFGFTDEFGFMALREDTAQYLGGSEYTCSESFRRQSDEAVSRLLKKLYEETADRLADKKELIIKLARKVFEEETMTGDKFIKYYESLKDTKE
ncbi:MAG TPA: hypothetical protein DCZ91_01415 [Lachnospiraceae bacterium]|nr:hypothetical protein [Lachnospiraceae bacterium]